MLLPPPSSGLVTLKWAIVQRSRWKYSETVQGAAQVMLVWTPVVVRTHGTSYKALKVTEELGSHLERMALAT